MGRRSPARYLAPLALVGFAVALAAVVSGSTGNDSAAPAARNSSTATGTTAQKSSKKRTRKYYVVKAGDTPSAIADKTGVPLTTIEELNPELDPQFLKPGDRVRLRP